jgi:hypothetical protein
LNLLDAARVRLESVDGIFPELIDEVEISREGVGVLVVFGGNVGPDGIGKRLVVGSAEGDLEDIPRLHVVVVF